MFIMTILIYFRRIFKEPIKREVYVCYEDGVSQNMVEIAFKLGINASK